MSKGFGIYKIRSNFKIVGKETHSIELNFGCDGDRHAVCITKVYMDERGKVTYAEKIGDVVTGMCDGTCEKVPILGGFLLHNEVENEEDTKTEDEDIRCSLAH